MGVPLSLPRPAKPLHPPCLPFRPAVSSRREARSSSAARASWRRPGTVSVPSSGTPGESGDAAKEEEEEGAPAAPRWKRGMGARGVCYASGRCVCVGGGAGARARVGDAAARSYSTVREGARERADPPPPSPPPALPPFFRAGALAHPLAHLGHTRTHQAHHPRPRPALIPRPLHQHARRLSLFGERTRPVQNLATRTHMRARRRRPARAAAALLVVLLALTWRSVTSEPDGKGAGWGGWAGACGRPSLFLGGLPPPTTARSLGRVVVGTRAGAPPCHTCTHPCPW